MDPGDGTWRRRQGICRTEKVCIKAWPGRCNAKPGASPVSIVIVVVVLAVAVALVCVCVSGYCTNYMEKEEVERGTEKRVRSKEEKQTRSPSRSRGQWRFVSGCPSRQWSAWRGRLRLD